MTVGPLARRRAVALAGHTGDETTARAALDDPDPAVRATALGALDRLGALDDATWRAALDDPAAPVRRRACELAATRGATGLAPLTDRLGDHDDGVVEAACFALGEVGSAATAAVSRLAAVTADHRDPLVREAAVAALGAIGDPAGLTAILEATGDRPAVRRRAVLALAPFEGPEVDAALSRALSDRDWQVRQAAEDLGARPADDAPAPPVT
ncbi:MAG TPA: HEAT repeat domain-containing protein [Acidimicrobiales bacterium]|nr:HEAT repeat domain-containing protein [Acidimicrobiales bacterium]